MLAQQTATCMSKEVIFRNIDNFPILSWKYNLQIYERHSITHKCEYIKMRLKCGAQMNSLLINEMPI